jgi:hypothetical protein
MARADDDGTVHGGTVHAAVRVPPQRSFLLGEDNSVGEIVAGLDWTLCYVRWPIPPWASWLPHAMPAPVVNGVTCIKLWISYILIP